MQFLRHILKIMRKLLTRFPIASNKSRLLRDRVPLCKTFITGCQVRYTSFRLA